MTRTENTSASRSQADRPNLCESTGTKCARSRRFRLFAWAIGSVCVLLAATYVLRGPLLSGFARAWVVDEPVRMVDAIVILGGRPDLRALEAARLYHAGIAPRILYMDVRLSRSMELGIIPSEREQTHRLLLSNNVPESALEAIGHAVSTTYDESRAVQAWAQTSGAKSILIPTDISHTRRARWIFRKELKSTGVQIHIHALQPRQYGTGDWWRHEEGLIAFQNEVVKFLFYCLKY